MTRNGVQQGAELLGLLVERANFLEVLADGPYDKRALADILGTSRSTVDRVIRTLVNAGVVHQRDNGYELTLSGRCALDAYERYEQTVRGLTNAQKLLSMLPSDAPLDPVVLSGARVYTSSPDIPDAVIEQLFASIQDSETLYGIAPVAIEGQLEAFYDAATAGGTAVEMLVANELNEKLLDSPRSRSVIIENLQKDEVNVYRGEIPFGFGLWATDDEAGIVVYTDTGVGGVATNDNEEAISWVVDTFESLQSESEAVTLESVLDEYPDDPTGN
ncbi:MULTISPECIES: winged helix-turn-helix domain-containing protein [Haloferax]|uniref:Helix-turn-helix domain-containing protein n=1 Tax=Haloferax marinum TaxID=2666143 RepID=A0A6A8G9U5_9EURY|nr:MULTISPECIES: winged helix-turn-helix domain-containing protein [Haloferax]KAB1198675.1 winged helix-turn-helix transcriptional regulator [Haloferax sp. CBA1150]MRW97791.1 helix-turn-helix domain-containing protein [Haloferax marinum]